MLQVSKNILLTLAVLVFAFVAIPAVFAQESETPVSTEEVEKEVEEVVSEESSVEEEVKEEAEEDNSEVEEVLGGEEGVEEEVFQPSSIIPDNQITICHVVPDVDETIMINENAWSAHEAHGDYLGGCDDSDNGDNGDDDDGGDECFEDTSELLVWLTVHSSGDEVPPYCSGEEVEASVEIVARQVVCDSEDKLPNMSGGSDITWTTAQDHLELYPDNCWMQPYREFEYNLTQMTLPSDSTQYGGEWWETFGYTGLNGKKKVKITFDSVFDIPNQIRVRSVFEDGDFPFSHEVDNSDVSAEFYCDTDVMNYDNGDFIRDVEIGAKYQCVGFQVAEDTPTNVCVAETPGNLIENGGFEEPTFGSVWSTFTQDLVPGWGFNWMNDNNWDSGTNGDGPAVLEIQNSVGGNWAAGEGVQYAELGTHLPDGSEADGANLRIVQEFDTIPGATYNVLYKTAPRPNTGAASNILNMKLKRDGASTIAETHEMGAGGNAGIQWGTYEFSFVASSLSAELIFRDKGNLNTVGPLLDDVQVSCEDVVASPEEVIDNGGEGDDPTNTAPTISLIGSSVMYLTQIDTYFEEGADVDDTEEGDIDGQLVIAGDVVDTSTPGIYEVTYNADDTGLNDDLSPGVVMSALEVTRTIHVTDYCDIETQTRGEERTLEIDCEEEEEETSSGSNGSNGSGNYFRTNSGDEGEVLGASTESCDQFTTYMMPGDRGGEVEKLQEFLNDFMEAGLAVDGVYGVMTTQAVHNFQQLYFSEIIDPWGEQLFETTGNFLWTTRAWANELAGCSEGYVYVPEFEELHNAAKL